MDLVRHIYQLDRPKTDRDQKDGHLRPNTLYFAGHGETSILSFSKGSNQQSMTWITRLGIPSTSWHINFLAIVIMDNGRSLAESVAEWDGRE